MKRYFYLFLPVIVIFLLLGMVFLIPKINVLRTAQSPVTGISVSNNKTYSQSQRIKAKDFTVEFIHKNGKKSAVREDAVTVSRKRPAKTGKTTKVTVTCKDGSKEYTKEVYVKNKRDPVVRFKCGSPELDSVKAVLYSNGELCFEGQGDVRQFSDHPWKDYESEDDIVIKSVTFEEGVTPKIMDNWFSDMDTLEYVPAIPTSVESTAHTFENCESLTKVPDLTVCGNLLNTTSMYQGCISLQESSSLPASVRVAEAMYKEAEKLKAAPDLSGASSLSQAKEMFNECSNLVSASLPPALVNGESMYAGCINLKEMPQTPETVTNMANMYQGDYSLSAVTNVPAACIDYTSCFSGCSALQGTLTIQSNTTYWNGCFDDAAVATTINLAGNSSQLNAIALEYSNTHITVNGQMPQAQATAN